MGRAQQGPLFRPGYFSLGQAMLMEEEENLRVMCSIVRATTSNKRFGRDISDKLSVDTLSVFPNPSNLNRD